MPRKKLRAHRRRRAYNADELAQLWSGFSFAQGFGYGPEGVEAMREAWKDLAVREATYRLSGDFNSILRPAAWWLFESPEPRDHNLQEQDQLIRIGLTA